MTDLDKLSAYLDNELSTSERTQLEQRLAQEDELQQALVELEKGNVIAQDYFSELDKKPMPMNLEAMILNAKPQPNLEPKSAAIVDIFRRKNNKFTRQTWGLATAASIVFAVGIWMLIPPTESHMNAGLFAVLNTEPSGSVITMNPERKIEILASYKNSTGVICRSVIEHTPISSNPVLACFIQEKWQIETTDMGENYQAASSLDRQDKKNLMTSKQELLWLRGVRN